MGLNGTSHSFPHSEQVALCISLGSLGPKLLNLLPPPKFPRSRSPPNLLSMVSSIHFLVLSHVNLRKRGVLSLCVVKILTAKGINMPFSYKSHEKEGATEKDGVVGACVEEPLLRGARDISIGQTG